MAQPLKVTCPSCTAKFHVPPHHVRGKVVTFRCKKCKGTIPVDGRALGTATPPSVPAPPLPPEAQQDMRASMYGDRLSISDGVLMPDGLSSAAALMADTPA